MLISFTFRGEFTYQANLRIELNLTNTFRETQDYYVKHYADPVQQARDSKMSYRCPDRIYTGLQPYQGCVPLGVLYPRAGTLGGCTQHHAMIMVHPWESDFDNIASITGNSSWSAQTMRQYFVRLERNQYLPSSVVGHGYSGWLHITVTALTLVAEDLKLASLVVAAATALGKVSRCWTDQMRSMQLMSFPRISSKAS